MFIDQSNVDQYAHSRPCSKKTQPSSTAGGVCRPLQPQYHALFSSANHPGRVFTTGYDAGAHCNSHPYSTYEDGSDSDGITVEEIFPVGPLRDVRCVRDTLGVICGFQASSHPTSSDPHSQRRVRAASGQVAAVAAHSPRMNERNGPSTVSVCEASSCSYHPHHQMATGVGGVSPLAPVSPGESRLSEAHGLRQAQEAPDVFNSHHYSPEQRKPEGTGEPGSEANGEESVCRNLLPASPVAATRESPSSPPQQFTAQEQCTANNIRTVSNLGRTLSAATKALAEAAKREAQRREEEAARAQVVLVPSVEVQRVLDTLLSVALKEKVLLFEAYFTSLQNARAVMEQCEALRRRNDARAKCEADCALQDEERVAQHKLALYRQQQASERLRVEAEEKHRKAMKAAESRLVEMASTVQELESKVAQQEVDLQERQRAHDAELRARLQDVQESVLELRALQRAHGQATERWMTLQVVHNALQSRCKALRRPRWPHRQAKCVTVDDVVPLSGSVYDAPRVRPRVVSPGTTDKKVEAGEPLLFFANEKGNTCLSNIDGGRQDALASPESEADKPTALEALLARTRSDSGASLILPLHSNADDVNGKAGIQIPTRGGALLNGVAPSARGGFSSPPETPLITPSISPAADPHASTVGAGKRQSELYDDTDSPDVKFTGDAAEAENGVSQSTQRASLSFSGSSDGVYCRDVLSSAGQTSSFRPSRLNSVASTRQGSAPAPANPIDRLYQQRMPGIALERAVCNNVSINGNNNSVGASAVASAGEVETEGEDEVADGAEWERRMQRVAADVVQRELSRLLTFTVSSKQQQLDRSNEALPPRGSGREVRSIAGRQGDVVHASNLELCLSTPRASAEVMSGREPAEQDASQMSYTSVTLSALQWIRVCETAHLAAQLNSVLLDKLQTLSASLAQRVQLLEEKDWNKTMAKRFVAVEHAAALRRLVATVDKITHCLPPVTSSSAATLNKKK